MVNNNPVVWQSIKIHFTVRIVGGTIIIAHSMVQNEFLIE